MTALVIAMPARPLSARSGAPPLDAARGALLVGASRLIVAGDPAGATILLGALGSETTARAFRIAFSNFFTVYMAGAWRPPVFATFDPCRMLCAETVDEARVVALIRFACSGADESARQVLRFSHRLETIAAILGCATRVAQALDAAGPPHHSARPPRAFAPTRSGRESLFATIHSGGEKHETA